MLLLFNYKHYPTIVDIPETQGGGILGDDGEWYQPSLDTRQRRASIEDLKADIWHEIRNPAPKSIKIKPKAPQISQPIEPKEMFSEDELILAWWLMRN